MALPRHLGYLTAINNPADLRAMFDAPVEPQAAPLEGGRENLRPGLHARFGPGDPMRQQFVALDTAHGQVVVSGKGVYGARNLTGHK